MILSLKAKIWMTVLSIVLMFAFFILFYFPVQQEKYMMANYNREVEDLTKTVALGVKIALTEQNFEGVQTSMDFVKNNPQLKYVAMIQSDTVWNGNHTSFTVKKTIFKTYPGGMDVNPDAKGDEQMVIKSAPFYTTVMNGEIILAFSTSEIIQSKKHIRTTAMAVSGIVFIIGIFMGFWLAKNISIPVLELRDAALKVGEGDRTQQVKRHARDEIGELSEAFNKMVKDLYKAEERVKATQNQLIHAEKMASLGQLTAGIAHEIQNPLNFVNNFSDLSVQLIDEFNEAKDEQVKAELLEEFKKNLTKINHHGKRADSIVKSMLMHSRTGSGAKQLVDINQLCEEALNLSFHSLRAKSISFNCALEKKFAVDIPRISIIQEDILRVLINLLNNSFYAVKEKYEKGTANESYQALVSISTKFNQASQVVIVVSDNGSGIPKQFRDRIFQPFFSTKPSGEGTGLGLSLSYDIVTKSHNGALSVNSVEGEGTEFTITLPV
ncbi:MAG: HAMP domain-containing sensor histidine kinase [Bacteroidia bacterium]